MRASPTLLTQNRGDNNTGLRKRSAHWQSTPDLNASQLRVSVCRSKMRMSGLSKVEMSAFMGGRGPHGNGANCFEPTRTGPATRATRDKAEADHPERSCQTTEDQRPAHSSFAG